MLEKIAPYLSIIKAAAIVALIVGLFGYGYHTGAKHEKTKCQAEKDAAIKADIKQGNEAAKTLEVKKDERDANQKTITKYVDRIIDRPIYRSQCLDDDGLRTANAALKGGTATNTDKALSTTTAP